MYHEITRSFNLHTLQSFQKFHMNLRQQMPQCTAANILDHLSKLNLIKCHLSDKETEFQ